MPLTTRNTGRRVSQCPKLVPERAVTSQVFYSVANSVWLKRGSHTTYNKAADISSSQRNFVKVGLQCTTPKPFDTFNRKRIHTAQGNALEVTRKHVETVEVAPCTVKGVLAVSRHWYSKYYLCPRCESAKKDLRLIVWATCKRSFFNGDAQKSAMIAERRSAVCR
eukprot:2032332-Pleurochrysis_carterae.AAC.1